MVNDAIFNTANAMKTRVEKELLQNNNEELSLIQMKKTSTGFTNKFEKERQDSKDFKNLLKGIFPEDDAEEPCNPVTEDCDLSLPEVDTSDPGDDVEPSFDFGDSDEGEFEVSFDTDELDNTPAEPENKVDI